MATATKLWRAGKWPYITRAMLRDDGVHMLDYEGAGFKEREKPSYPSLDTMNKKLKELGFGEFEVVKEWPGPTY